MYCFWIFFFFNSHGLLASYPFDDILYLDLQTIGKINFSSNDNEGRLKSCQGLSIIFFFFMAKKDFLTLIYIWNEISLILRGKCSEYLKLQLDGPNRNSGSEIISLHLKKQTKIYEGPMPLPANQTLCRLWHSILLFWQVWKKNKKKKKIHFYIKL